VLITVLVQFTYQQAVRQQTTVGSLMIAVH